MTRFPMLEHPRIFNRILHQVAMALPCADVCGTSGNLVHRHPST